ncbi:Peroxisomal NADH pyrophosphatase nudt12 [Quaeritorhiza haematococci]|nr:Peroxisomal NADH pyrophosphatase nudt12 [Quaeritorhiza haematococci]
MTSLHDLCAAGDLQAIKTLLSTSTTNSSTNPHPFNTPNPRGWTPLHFAARFNHREVVKLLLERGADPQLRNDEGRTPGELAVRWGSGDVLGLLGVKEGDGEKVQERQGDGSGGKGQKGEEFGLTNFFAGSVLDRQSHKRATLKPTPSSHILLFNNNKPLLRKGSSTSLQIAWISYKNVEDILQNGEKGVEGLDFVYLGTEEDGVEGRWAVNVGEKGEEAKKAFEKTSESAFWADLRPHAFALEGPEAAMAAQGHSMVDWHARNKFCPACGSRTNLGEAGYKRVCTNESCISHKGVHNFSYPRTDPVIIVCIVSPKGGERCLLGRQKRWPPGMYSCVAGFMEPGETIEEAARREAAEETGVRVGRVMYHSSQPWPFPAQLMIGCFAEALSEDINLVDQELEDAKWFDRHHVEKGLSTPATISSSSTPQPLSTAAEMTTTPAPTHPSLATFIPKCPPAYAIAHQLVKAWVSGEFKGFEGVSRSKI